MGSYHEVVTVFTHQYIFWDKCTLKISLVCGLFFFSCVSPGAPECSAVFFVFFFLTIGSWRFLLAPASTESVHLLRVGVRSEDFVYPLCVERHVNEDARLVLSGAASAMDAHAHDDLDVAVLADQGTAVISLQRRESVSAVEEKKESHNPCLNLQCQLGIGRLRHCQSWEPSGHGRNSWWNIMQCSRQRGAGEGLSQTWRTFG